MFLDSRAPRFHRDFDIAKHNVVALLHAATAEDPYDKELIEIIGTLSTQSEEFRSLWASHDVYRYRSGQKMLTHSAVGDLDSTIGVPLIRPISHRSMLILRISTALWSTRDAFACWLLGNHSGSKGAEQTGRLGKHT